MNSVLKARSQHAERKALLAVAATLGEDLGQVMPALRLLVHRYISSYIVVIH